MIATRELHDATREALDIARAMLWVLKDGWIRALHYLTALAWPPKLIAAAIGRRW